MSGWRFAFLLAGRELRGGLKGLRVFALALALGVAAVAAIGSLAAAFENGLEDQKRALLGGDVEATSITGPLDEATETALARLGRLSRVVDAQLMARRPDGEAGSVVMLKGVDDAYPLEGAVTLRGGGRFRDCLAPDADMFGAAVDPAMLDRLSLKVGDAFVIGRAAFRVKGVIEEEPDRASAGFLLGPRVLVTQEAAAATGLLATSALVNRHYRIVAAGGADAILQSQKTALEKRRLRVRTAADAARGLERVLRNLTIFFTTIGLASLAIGGIGAQNAVAAYLARKTSTIATLKCLGATGDDVVRAYLLQILVIATIAVALGLGIGALTPFIVGEAARAELPFGARASIYPVPLAQAAAFGLLAALAFAWPPLARTKAASAAELFRSVVAPAARPPLADMTIAVGFGLGFVGLAAYFAEDRRLALGLAGAGIAAYVALRGLVFMSLLVARRFWRPRRGPLRIAVSNLVRPGAPSGAVAVSLGLGLTLLAAVSIIDANLSRNLTEAFPARAPGLFFTDIPYEAAPRFDADAARYAASGAYERYYMLRAGIVSIKGVPLADAPGARRSPWARDNDWGVTILDQLPPELGKVTAGAIWPKGYRGPPLLALASWQGRLLGVGPGDVMALSVAGRVVEARIACLYEQNFDRGGLNFVAAFAPGTLEAARPTSVASLKAASVPAEDAAASALAKAYPSVAIIRTREVIETIGRTLRSAGAVIRLLTISVIASGVVVLLGAIAAAFARKLKDAMIMKTVGASRARILAAEAIEYAALGLFPAIAATLLGAAIAWVVVARQMEMDWFAPWGVVFAIVAGAAGVTLALGLLSARIALATRPNAVLRGA
ncbi:MAG: ABC transporter permease [Parvularculaceae bacterium]|nr:ABC transporter permease [Parvularculaceae bacterium]